MRISFLILLWLSFSAQAAVDHRGQFAAKITIDHYGVYKLLEKNQRQLSVDSTAGYNSVIKAALLEKTTQIPLQQGKVFGFTYQITDHAVNQQWVPVTIEYKHPQLHDFLGRLRTGFTRKSAARLQADGRFSNGAYYIFSEPEEMIAGEWQIRVIYLGDIIATQRFTVQ